VACSDDNIDDESDVVWKSFPACLLLTIFEVFVSESVVMFVLVCVALNVQSCLM